MPYLHDTYRKKFNAVDLYNRDCFGNYSVQFAVQTKNWYRRLFLALLGICETNALKAYRKCVGDMERYTWLMQLSEKLINNPFLPRSDAPGPSTAVGNTDGECGSLVYMQYHGRCNACGVSTH